MHDISCKTIIHMVLESRMTSEIHEMDAFMVILREQKGSGIMFSMKHFPFLKFESATENETLTTQRTNRCLLCIKYREEKNIHLRNQCLCFPQYLAVLNQ